MPVDDSRPSVKAFVDAFTARVVIPALDLRALVQSAMGVVPFLAWAIATGLSDSVYSGEPIAMVAMRTLEFIVTWLVWVTGMVVVAIGGALFVHRRSTTLKPYSLTLTSLVIVGLILFVESVSFGLWAVFAGLRDQSALRGPLWLDIGLHVAQQTSLLVAVAVASRLYLAWRKSSPDPLDAKRFIALSLIALGLMLASILRHAFHVLTVPTVDRRSIPLTLFSWVEDGVASLVINFGAVVLLGFAATTLLRWARVERNLMWVTVASTVATASFVFAQAGSQLVPVLQADPKLVVGDWLQVGPLLAVTLLGGSLYLLVVYGNSGLPSLRELRHWPGRPPEEEE